MSTVDINNVTNTDKTGTFDKLMESINAHIETQYLNNRITGADYATVYLGSIQAALGQSIQFSLQEKLVEAQIATANIETQTKQFELDNILPKQLVKMSEEIDLLVTQESELVLNGIKQRLLQDEQIAISSAERDIKAFELNNMLPEQLIKIQEEIDLLITQDSELLLNGTKQRLLQDEQIASSIIDKGIKQFQLDNMLPEELIKLKEEIDLLITQENEMLLDGVKKRESVDAQIAISTVEKNSKQYEFDFILPEQLTKLQEEIDLLASQDSELLLNGLKQRELQDGQIKAVYTDRVLKDKQAAKLGLDNVMKQMENNRVDLGFVYTPNYNEV